MLLLKDKSPGFWPGGKKSNSGGPADCVGGPWRVDSCWSRNA